MRAEARAQPTAPTPDSISAPGNHTSAIADKTVDPNTVALSDTVLQSSSAIVKIFGDATIKRKRQRLYNVNNEWPAEDEDVTRGQLIALNTMVFVAHSPYADF